MKLSFGLFLNEVRGRTIKFLLRANFLNSSPHHLLAIL
ncbi:hypothetical protein TSIB_1271 [Thermococcus sibiricus MM 739]|uniref:Uncharacterized protein n=1 Tax=Thermococcus sibiricus (strain DSM 12597 / MM 739) TaxID=604354 RepID=C6A3Y0_THESM|nr:hypothetical protein TSIB_1271 [Thermococcus sibiricus MM 739]